MARSRFRRTTPSSPIFGLFGDQAMALEEQVAALEDLVHYGPPTERVGNA